MHVVPGPDLSARQLHDLLELRAQVFVVEQDCVYLDIDGLDLDAQTDHLWFDDDRGITAALRIIDDGDRRRIGRVVTRSDQRGNGLASRLIQGALGHLGDRPSRLDAQSHLQAFYEQFGFRVTGAEFVEDGIPHVPMQLDPRPPGTGDTNPSEESS